MLNDKDLLRVLTPEEISSARRKREKSSQWSSTPQKLSKSLNDLSSQSLIPLSKADNLNNRDLACISPEDLQKALNLGLRKIIIIDCRFNYEYEGGHIIGSVNIPTQKDLEEYFFSILPEKMAVEKSDLEQLCIVFHCEFSSKRAPEQFRKLRSLDRIKNIDSYPKLTYKNVFLLNGGYKRYWETFPTGCEPQNYIQMLHPDFRIQLPVCNSSLKVKKVDPLPVFPQLPFPSLSESPKQKHRKLPVVVPKLVLPPEEIPKNEKGTRIPEEKPPTKD